MQAISSQHLHVVVYNMKVFHAHNQGDVCSSSLLHLKERGFSSACVKMCDGHPVLKSGNVYLHQCAGMNLKKRAQHWPLSCLTASRNTIYSSQNPLSYSFFGSSRHPSVLQLRNRLDSTLMPSTFNLAICTHRKFSGRFPSARQRLYRGQSSRGSGSSRRWRNECWGR